MNRRFTYRFLLTIALIVLCNTMEAVTYYWVRTTAGTWTTGSSWSLSSGGVPLIASAPTLAGDIAVFDNGGWGTCSVINPITITAITTTGTFAGLITNGGFAINLSGSLTFGAGTFNNNGSILNVGGNFTQTGGVFNGGTGAIRVTGNFTKTNGTHNATNNVMELRGNFTVGANTFNHNGGTVLFSGVNPIVNIVSPLAFVTISPLTTTNLNVTGVLTALGTFRLLGTGAIRIMGGSVEAYSDVLLNNTATTGGGTGTMRMVGSGSHSFISSVPIGQCRLPNVTVAMTGGNFAFNGSVSIAGSFLYDPPGTVGCSAVHAVGATVAFTGTGVTVNCVDLVSMGNIFIFFPHVVVMNGSSVTLASEFECNNLTLQNGGTLDVSLSNYYLGVAGDWLNQNTTATSFNERNGAVRMVIGSITSSVIGGESFYQLILDCPAGGAWITLNSRVNVIFQLRDNMNTLMNVMFTSAAAPLVFLDNATMWYSSPEWMSLVVIGPIIKIGDDAFSFPTGAQIGFQFYPRPITISAPVITTDAFTAQYYAADADPLYDNALRVPSLVSLSDCEYWTLNRTTGMSNVNVTLSWWSTPTPSCAVVSIPHMAVAGWNGAQWINHGQSTSSGSASMGTVTSLLAVNNFGPFTLGSIGTINPLPVELTSFSAEAEMNHVNVQWSTATETNNNYFIVEKSTDGSTVQSVDTIPGNGTTSSIHVYSLTDYAPFDGQSYYRLTQVDFDGRTTRYDWQPVTITRAPEIQCYPNPSQGELHVELPGEADEYWTAIVTDVTGKVVWFSQAKRDTFRTIHIDLLPGTYVMLMSSAGVNYSQRLVITE